jgi:uracil-DNA glycosylase
MSEVSRLCRDELARQIRQHLQSLKTAGVDWLPACDKSEVMVLLPSAVEAPAQPEQDFFRDVNGPEPVERSSANSSMTLEQRRQELKVLAETVRQCSRCPELASTRTQTVFGVGQAGAELCFIGEAPGADEDAQGEPFVGAAGQLLDKIIAACKMKREEVYICNIIKCRPPGNRTPLPNEAASCRDFLEKQLELVQPKFICALGSTAARYLLNTTQGIGQLRGRFHSYRGIPVMCTYHPAYLLPHRSPGKKKDVWEDMKMLLAKMGRPIP